MCKVDKLGVSMSRFDDPHRLYTYDSHGDTEARLNSSYFGPSLGPSQQSILPLLPLLLDHCPAINPESSISVRKSRPGCLLRQDLSYPCPRMRE